jgi:membrane protease YdiL (CAAX protease family)
MKKCPYCGKEYPDDVERCLIDDELLLGDKLLPSDDADELAVLESSSSTASETVASPPAAPWTDRQLRIFEIVLVCVIAFGTGILSSGHSLYLRSFGDFQTSGGSSSGEYGWIYSCLREASALGFLWYVLQRHGKTFVDLGLTWMRKDIGWSIILAFGGSLAFDAVYDAIYFSGLTATSHKAASAYVGYVLFGGGVFFTTMLFQFLNPFFEELIVRAYVMTEVKQLTNSATKAIIISTVLQTSYHFYQGAPMAFAHGATFLIWSIYYAKTSRIAPIILAHLYSDVGGTLLHLFHH